MVNHDVLRVFPSGSTLFFQPIPTKATDTAVSLPPCPAPPMVVLRVSITFHRHPMCSLQIKTVSSERIGRLLKFEECLTFGGKCTDFEPILPRVKEAAESQGRVLRCFFGGCEAQQ